MASLENLKGVELLEQFVPLLGVPKELLVRELEKYLRTHKIPLSDLCAENLRGFAGELLLDLACDHKEMPSRGDAI